MIGVGSEAQTGKSPAVSSTQNSRRRSFRAAVLLLLLMMAPATLFAAPPITIQLAHMSMAEFLERAELMQLLKKYDLIKFTFTDRVIINEYAVNHSFPVITLNVVWRSSPDALLLSYIHEQLHWYLRAHNAQRLDAIRQLRRLYPNAPVAYPKGGGTAVSTYGHLVVCYLEMQAGRQLIGEKRTKAVIEEIPWYTWIWKTVVKDEATVGGIVTAEHLEIK